MAVTTRKSGKKPKAKQLRLSTKKSRPEHAEDIASLQRELAALREQEAATSEILRLIADTSGDPQSVLDAIVKSTARLCDAEDASVRLVDGDVLRLMAHVGSIPSTSAEVRIADEPLNRHVLTSGETVHIHDILAENGPMFAPTRARVGAVGVRTLVYALRSTGVSMRLCTDGAMSARFSNPVAITVILTWPSICGFTTAPKMMFASSCAAL